MPRYFYECGGCGKSAQRICSPEQSKEARTCPSCSMPLKRVPQPASTTILETLDNGIMSRKVTRLADAERIFKERADNDPRLKDPLKS